MFIAVSKENNVFIARSNVLEHWDNGYPLFPKINMAFVPENTHIYEVNDIPEPVSEYKHCYTPKAGFYENQNYRVSNQYGITDELLQRIKNDAVAEIEEAVINGTDE